MQPSFLPLSPRFDGADVRSPDHARLSDQIARVYAVLGRGQWVTVSEIARLTRDPEVSVSAQIRNLRKPRFGGHDIRRRRRGLGALSEYLLVKPEGL